MLASAAMYSPVLTLECKWCKQALDATLQRIAQIRLLGETGQYAPKLVFHF